MTKQSAVIDIDHLCTQYENFKALDQLCLRVEQAEIYGFLGPNGAGKTTTIKALLGIIKPAEGRIFLFGQELRGSDLDLKRKIGVVSEKQHVYKEMTAWEYLSFFGEIYQVRNKAKRIESLLEQLDLIHVMHKRLETFSHGMQQKIGFIRAFLHDPELLILDEPISGLDPNGVKQIRDLISEANEKGKTVFISSHVLSEVEKLCHKVGIIDRGKLLVEERMENINRRLVDIIEVEVELLESKAGIIDSLRSLAFVEKIIQEKNFLRIQVKSDKDYRAQISKTVTENGGLVLGIKNREMSLEEAFMAITSKNVPLFRDSSARP